MRPRKRTIRVGQLLAEEEPLDTAEQEDLIAGLADIQVSQQRTWHTVWALLISFLSLTMLYLALKQAVTPWGTRHHAYFKGTASSSAVAGGEALAAVSLGMTCLTLLPQWLQAAQRQQKWHLATKVAAFATALVNVLFWSVAIGRACSYREEPWAAALKYVWLPLGPAGLVCLALYIMRTLKKDAESIEQLKSNLYNFKKA